MNWIHKLMPKKVVDMKIVVGFLAVLLISSTAYAQSEASKGTLDSISTEARLSLNEEEIKIAHARLLAAEAQLKNAVNPEETQADSASSEVPNAISATENTATSTLSSKTTNLVSSQKNMVNNKISQLEAEKMKLQRELNFSKDRLLVAETEVERLQGLIESRTKRMLSPVSNSSNKSAESNNSQQAAVSQSPLLSGIQKEKASTDMPIVTVTARKANLRIGPSESDSPLMEVASGTRLVVETRIGEWYRIIAPTGVRAWISAKVVAFGDSGVASPDRVTRIAGFDSSVEDEAFGLIANLSR